MRVNQHNRLAAETNDDRETRLQQLRVNQQDRLAAETNNDRETRLKHLRANQQDILGAETNDDRETRLQHLRAKQQDRLAAETDDDREVQLQRLRNNQQHRLNEENAGEREKRLQNDRESHRQQRLAQQRFPVLEQQSVQAKMRAFHRHLNALHSVTCTTCSEGFPSLKLHAQTSECVRCSKDKHMPKMYSAANNMDPGPVPPQLLVSSQSMYSTHFMTATQMVLIYYIQSCLLHALKMRVVYNNYYIYWCMHASHHYTGFNSS